MDELDTLGKQITKEYYSKINEIKRLKKLKSDFKIGDFVKVTWESRDYGIEFAFAYIYFVMERKNGYKGFHYYFNKAKTDDTQSKFGLNLPKYSKIISIVKI